MSLFCTYLACRLTPGGQGAGPCRAGFNLFPSKRAAALNLHPNLHSNLQPLLAVKSSPPQNIFSTIPVYSFPFCFLGTRGIHLTQLEVAPFSNLLFYS